MSIPPPAGAVLFDLDGTLVDNMELHREAFDAFSRRHGIQITDDQIRVKLAGKRNADIFPVLLGRELPADVVRELSNEKESLYREISRGRLAPVAGLEDFLGMLEGRRIPTAIATSAPQENITHTLSELGLAGRFRVIVRGEEVSRGKPFPDVFLECARRLGVPPRECMGLEDALPGVEAVRAAGMQCVALTTTVTAEELAAHGQADWIVADYKELLVRIGD